MFEIQLFHTYKEWLFSFFKCFQMEKSIWTGFFLQQDMLLFFSHFIYFVDYCSS
jgi:hypothetical protein